MKIMSTILGSQAQKAGLGKEKYAPRPARGRKPGLEREKYVPRPGDGNYVNYFGESSPESGSRERKICAQTRSRKKAGSRECENKQLDPENENYVNHFGQSSPESGSRERKIRAQTRLRKETGSGNGKIRS